MRHQNQLNPNQSLLLEAEKPNPINPIPSPLLLFKQGQKKHQIIRIGAFAAGDIAA